MSASARFGGLGALTGFLGVAAGAFGAHALRGSLSPERLQVFETGARYQLIHALALVLVALALRDARSAPLSAAGWLFVAGQILFAGSLYALALTGVRVWGAVTPVGGACFLAGWAALGVGLARERRGGAVNRTGLSLLGAAALVLALHAAPVRAAEPESKPPAWDWPARAENLKILPERTSADQLRGVMTGFTRALGVRCSHCHVGDEGKPLSTYDFASDRNPKKGVARRMMGMVKLVNKELRDIAEDAPNAKLAGLEVQCVTCHRGLPTPMTLPGVLTQAYTAAGADSAIARYGALRRGAYGAGGYDFREASLDEVGQYAMEHNDAAGAVKIFELNMTEFPESGRVYERLGRAYLALGDTARAVVSYRRALNVDPSNRAAAESLRELLRRP